jgi:putative oxidoreductase
MRYLKIAGTVMLWVLQILVSVGFVLTGVAKFRPGFWVAGFARWGYPDSFRMLIGVLEIAGGLLLAFPATASYAAAFIGCIMVGAVGTLFMHNEPSAAPIVWMVALAFLGFVRRRRAWRPVPDVGRAAGNPV